MLHRKNVSPLTFFIFLLLYTENSRADPCDRFRTTCNLGACNNPQTIERIQAANCKITFDSGGRATLTPEVKAGVSPGGKVAEPEPASARPASPSRPGQEGYINEVKKDADIGQRETEVKRTRVGEEIKGTRSLAQEALNSAQRYEQSFLRTITQKSTQEQGYFRQDQALLRNIEGIVERQSDLPLEKAESAKLPDFRKDFVLISAALGVNQELKQEHTRLSAQAAQLAQMAAQLAQSASGLGALPQSTVSSASHADSLKPSATSGVSNPGKDSTVSAKSKKEEIDSENAEGKAAVAEAKKMLEDAKAKKARAKGYASGSALRDKLSGEIKSRDGTGASAKGGAGADGGAGGEPSRTDQIAKAMAGTIEESEAAAKGSVFGAEPGSGGSRFSLSGSETDAEVKRLVDQARELGSADSGSMASAAGVLGSDTLSLFDRVKTAHQSCLKQKCVLSASLQK